MRALVIAGLLVSAPAASFNSVPAAAQSPAPAQPQQCADTAQKKAKRSMFGGLVSGLGGSLLGRAGVAGNVISLAMPVGSYLTDELLKMLDCKEQKQAAKATDAAMRRGVGAEVGWTSESRPNVSGKSKVTAAEQLADGTQCMTVTDVVIVDGEATTVPQKIRST